SRHVSVSSLYKCSELVKTMVADGLQDKIIVVLKHNISYPYCCVSFVSPFTSPLSDMFSCFLVYPFKLYCTALAQPRFAYLLSNVSLVTLHFTASRLTLDAIFHFV